MQHFHKLASAAAAPQNSLRKNREALGNQGLPLYVQTSSHNLHQNAADGQHQRAAGACDDLGKRKKQELTHEKCCAMI